MQLSESLKMLTWFITLLSLFGTVLNIRKSIWCFYIWTFGNAAWLVVDIIMGYYSRAVLDLVHFILAIWGIVAWRSR